MKKIKFLPQHKECFFSEHATILDVAIANEIPLNHSCGGMGSCTTCLVVVREGAENLPERNDLEQEHAQARQFKKNERLACQTEAVDDLVLEIP